MNKLMKKSIAFIITMAMLVTVMPSSLNASAASAKVTISATSVSVTVGSTKKVTVKNAPSKAKTKWKSYNKKVAKVTNGKIKGVKAGSTKVKATVVFKKNGKKYTKKFYIKVTVKKKTITTAAPATVAPVVTTAVAATTPAVQATIIATTEITATPVKTSKPKATEFADVTVEPYATSPQATENVGEEHKSANGITTKDNGNMRTELSSQDLIKNYMGTGINIGNTLEATTTKVNKDKAIAAGDATAFETAWGNKVVTQKYIDGLKYYGFNTVRIPVAWSNMISDGDDTYEINEAYLNRVEEVMNYCLNDGMYVIINDHWDSQWWGMFGSKNASVRDAAWAKYEAMWTQLANRYKDYSDHLILEGGNEELGTRLNDSIDQYGYYSGYLKDSGENEVVSIGTMSAVNLYETVNAMTQKFVDIVRGTGGNNTYRHLLIPGYNTNIEDTCNTKYVMPTDLECNAAATKQSVSVHYYTPWDYCGDGNSSSYAWGSGTNKTSDFKEMYTHLNSMTKFTNQGYGVILGEYGVLVQTNTNIPLYLTKFNEYCKYFGYTPCMWETGNWINRETGEFKYKDVAQAFIDFTGSDATAPSAKNSGPSTMVSANESDLNLLYTWTGNWVKYNNKNADTATYSAISCSDDLKVQCNGSFYYLFITADWSKMTAPYIKLTTDTDEVSLASTVQLDYISDPDGIIDSQDEGTWYDKENYSEADGWIGTPFALNKTDLDKYGTLILTVEDTYTLKKIEIFDKK